MAEKYTIRETARLTGYSVRNIRCLIHKGVVPAEKNPSGHWWYIDQDQIQILCDRRAKNDVSNRRFIPESEIGRVKGKNLDKKCEM